MNTSLLHKTTLLGKTALVTGSTSGIGLGVATELAKAGASIILNGFGDPEQIVQVEKRLEALSVKVGYHGADLGRPGQIDELMGYAEDFGGIDILVNNAGIQHVARVDDFPVERWDAVIAINLSAAFHTTQRALPGMRTRGWGRIINIASTHGLVASAQKSAYVAAKHGLIGFTKSVALELADSAITCNAICPGWVRTPLVEKQIATRAEQKKISLAQAQSELLMEKQPSGQFITPEQLGALALFLCSDAASEVRGVAWNMDGGWVAQ